MNRSSILGSRSASSTAGEAADRLPDVSRDAPDGAPGDDDADQFFGAGAFAAGAGVVGFTAVVAGAAGLGAAAALAAFGFGFALQ